MGRPLRTRQERIASALSREFNGSSSYVYCKDKSIEVYVPSLDIVFMIGVDCSVKQRPALRAGQTVQAMREALLR